MSIRIFIPIFSVYINYNPLPSRKFLLLSIILTKGIFTTAQTRFSFFAGPQATTVHYVVRGSEQSTDFKFGFQAGVGAKIEFDNKLYFSPAIYYSLKGYKVVLKQGAYPPGLLAITITPPFIPWKQHSCCNTISAAAPRISFLKADLHWIFNWRAERNSIWVTEAESTGK